MLKRVTPDNSGGIDPVPVVLNHLETGNDVIRTEAIGALAAIVPADERVRTALLKLLEDEDADVRCDAMEALPAYARTEDGEAICASLVGDPVREVKLAAIDLLAALKDEGSVPLLRKLALSRCEDEVAWEDEAGLWDEWLEVQVAAIRALGKMGITDAIEDLLSARNDEFGQNLDLPVFDALASMGSAGMAPLLAIAKGEKGLSRKRALEAMARLDPAALEPHLDLLFADENADVRRLALKAFDKNDDRLVYLALKDKDAALRCEALAIASESHPNLTIAALSDMSPEVQAVALDKLVLPDEDENLREALDANMQAWMLTDEGVLASSSARNWLRLMGETHTKPLLDLVRDGERPLEARIVATQALTSLTDSSATERLISLLSNPAQQVRLVLLTELVRRTDKGDETALEALCIAAEETLFAPENQQASPEDEVSEKNEEEAAIPVLQINDQGEIVACEETVAQNSTLAAIQISRVANRPTSKKAAGKKLRRPIEGPSEISRELARVALGLLGPVGAELAGNTIREMTGSVKDDLRLAAFYGLEKRLAAKIVEEGNFTCVRTGLKDRLANIRSLAARIAADHRELHDELMAMVEDDDAVVRALAIGCQKDEQILMKALGDDHRQVRTNAVRQLLQNEAEVSSDNLLDQLIASEGVEEIALAFGASKDIRAAVLSRLDDRNLSLKNNVILLKALAATSPAFMV